jgi:hypothetical protein
MTTDELTTYVWDRLPARRRLVGRRVVDRIVRRAVRTWPHGVIEQCDRQQCDVLGKYWIRSIERGERHEVQGFLASIVLGAIIAKIVGLLIDWWWARQENRLAILEMTRAV